MTEETTFTDGTITEYPACDEIEVLAEVAASATGSQPNTAAAEAAIRQSRNLPPLAATIYQPATDCSHTWLDAGDWTCRLNGWKMVMTCSHCQAINLP